MRLVLVHGINNEMRSAAEIENIWTGALYAAWTRDGLPQPAGLEVTTVYYADQLAKLSGSSSSAVAAGAGGQASQIEFELLQEYADAFGLTDDEVALAAMEAGVDLSSVEAGTPHKGWVIGLSRALERILPTKGKYLARLFLRQAALYIERQGVQTLVKNIVRKQGFVESGPMVVLAHSLGTVISYELLMEVRSPDFEIHLFCTLGSPLGVAIVSNYLGRRTAFPRPPIQRWINGVHRQDFVTLGRILEKSNMGFDGIENDCTIVNNDEDKHDVRAYLSNRSIAAAIHTALTK